MTVPFYVPPEQLIKDRAEFARKGIARGKSIVTLEYDVGILLLADSVEAASRSMDKPAPSRIEQLVNDISLLNTLGIRLVLVHGARPQIEQRLRQLPTRHEAARPDPTRAPTLDPGRRAAGGAARQGRDSR